MTNPNKTLLLFWLDRLRFITKKSLNWESFEQWSGSLFNMEKELLLLH